jgi:hypothetical protein
MNGRRRTLALLVLLAAGVAVMSCGGGDGGGDGDNAGSVAESVTAKEAVAAFEQAARGYRFEKTTSLVEGAVAYGPVGSSDPDEVRPINEALGDGSLLWQVLVFGGPDPPLERDAAKAAAFSSNTFEPAGEGIYIGDSNIAYVASRNVVITGPVLNGDPDDETLVRWKAVLDRL